jgi:hypothetical protein
MSARTGPGGTGDLLALLDADERTAQLEAEVDTLRRWLREAVELLDVAAPAPTRVRALRDAAGLDPEGGTPEQRRDAGIARAAARWTPEELADVDHAIATVAERGVPFTTDDVWNTLPAGFPVTKGIAGRLISAANAGVIRNTGDTVISIRQGAHGHRQRLTVWAPA